MGFGIILVDRGDSTVPPDANRHVRTNDRALDAPGAVFAVGFRGEIALGVGLLRNNDAFIGTGDNAKTTTLTSFAVDYYSSSHAYVAQVICSSTKQTEL